MPGSPSGIPQSAYKITKLVRHREEVPMSIATKHGDGGQTGLAGGTRISKADLRVEAYGSVDELNTALGFARSICSNQQIHDWTEQIQRTLFSIGGALASPPE